MTKTLFPIKSINFGWPQLFGSAAILMIVLFFLWKQKRNLPYLLSFSVFWVYMTALVSLVVFPFPLPSNAPNFHPRVNLIPLNFGSCSLLFFCIRNIYGNILLTIPFGFGISFIKPVKGKNIFWLALLVGFSLEFIQLIISLIVRSSFRIVDINDMLLNAIGVLIGYGLFRLFGWLYLILARRSEIQNKGIFSYIYSVVRHSTD